MNATNECGFFGFNELTQKCNFRQKKRNKVVNESLRAQALTPFRSPGKSSARMDAQGNRCQSIRAPAPPIPHRVVNQSLRAHALTPFRFPGESSARMDAPGDLNGVRADFLDFGSSNFAPPKRKHSSYCKICSVAQPIVYLTMYLALHRHSVGMHLPLFQHVVALGGGSL